MKKDQTYYIELISKHLSGEISSEELHQLFHWIKEDVENEKLFQSYQTTWLTLEHSKVEDELDVDAEWSRFEEKIEQPNRTLFTATFRTFLKVAAILLLAALPGYLLLQYLSNPKMELVLAQNGIVEKVLPDGTTVTLNSGASIRYPEKFTKKTRTVELNGEGYFEVKHDDNHPFIIKNDNLRVEVLGTTFYVNTKSEEKKAEVILNSGSVAVYFSDKIENRVILQPGEKVAIEPRTEQLDKSVNEDANFLAWKTGKLEFTGASLQTILIAINKIYHSDIRIASPNIANCSVTATFDNQSLESVLNVLQATLDLQVKRNGGTIELSGNGCK